MPEARVFRRAGRGKSAPPVRRGESGSRYSRRPLSYSTGSRRGRIGGKIGVIQAKLLARGLRREESRGKKDGSNDETRDSRRTGAGRRYRRAARYPGFLAGCGAEASTGSQG